MEGKPHIDRRLATDVATVAEAAVDKLCRCDGIGNTAGDVTILDVHVAVVIAAGQAGDGTGRKDGAAVLAVPAKDAEALREGVVDATVSLVVVVGAARRNGVVRRETWRSVGRQYSQDVFCEGRLRTNGNLAKVRGAAVIGFLSGMALAGLLGSSFR